MKYQGKFDELKLCVIIPTYNNSSTLSKIISDVLEFTRNIIVVNDGSVDSTREILKTFQNINVYHLEENRGKGIALRTGFQKALSMGYEHAITIDSDGQHFANDIPEFVTKYTECPGAIIIGARNMDQQGIPGKSSFGHKFSNFWFRVETGIKAPDTQSGFRLYPLKPLNDFHFHTSKFEFEIEVLVRAAWAGIKIESVPVTVYYAQENRVTHFRPFRDFTRVSILNTVLVILSFVYIRPRNFIRKIFDRKELKRIINEHFLHPHESDLVKSLSVAFGLFMGIVPIWGFQLIVGIFLAVLFRLNKPIFILAANISIPPMIPLILFLSYKMGEYWMGSNAINISFDKHITLEAVKQNWLQYLYGSITLAVVAGIAGGLICLTMLKVFKRRS